MAQEQSSQKVAQLATQQASGSLDALILLGTFGSGERPRALVRTPDGKVVELKVGDRIGRDPIIAIEDGRLALSGNGRTRWMTQPVVQ
ncbi:MAG: pilus assembly protein PilP [Sagittula sp.]|jgi:Tfp pilus assembly protein PilP|uniref:pilus assembly protein PilP n=1 Tax=unclassified Sagittula TaxID=2624628 RepID=UPI0024C36878|nr:pilus assembly protein PilP [Sagittula sp. MA-2]WHZ36985.1 pilus assembly protein PilP [Sagittula sp. MA-2]